MRGAFMDYKELDNKLKSIKKLDKEIKVVNLEIQYLDSGIFKQSTLTDTKVKASKTQDMADKYNSLLERKEKLSRRIDTLMAERDSFVSLIDDNLKAPDQRTILRLLYVLDMTVDDIADFLGVTVKTVFVHRRQALEQLAKQTTSLLG